MKARRRTRKTRWLLIGLLLGFLAVTGLALLYPRRMGSLAGTSVAAPPARVPSQAHAAFLAAIGEAHPMTIPAGAGPDRQPAQSGQPNTSTSRATGQSPAPSNASTGPNVIPGQPASHPESAPPSESAANPAPQSGAGEFAYDGYVPLDCELPAGCGVGGSASGSPAAAGGMPVVHSPQTHRPPSYGGNQQTDGGSGSNSQPGGSGPGSDPPGQGSDPPVASAPELDPATLAAAVTLLLGSLAVLSGRRVRARS